MTVTNARSTYIILFSDVFSVVNHCIAKIVQHIGNGLTAKRPFIICSSAWPREGDLYLFHKSKWGDV